MAQAVLPRSVFSVVALVVLPVTGALTPTNSEECSNLPGVDKSVFIVWDSRCPGGLLGCIQSYPCRYDFLRQAQAEAAAAPNDAAAPAEAAAVQVSNREDCRNLPGVDKSLPIVYDDSCPRGLGCIQSYPCRYDFLRRLKAEAAVTPNNVAAPAEAAVVRISNTEECRNLPGVDKSLPIVYDVSCPRGQGCIQDFPCRYDFWRQSQEEAAVTPNNVAAPAEAERGNLRR